MKTSRTSWLSVGMVAIWAVCGTTTLIADPISGPITNPATGDIYYLLQNSDWTDAESQALSLGGNLATVNNAAENAWISQTFSNFGGVQRNLWIGLNAVGGDGGNPNDYHWVDGSSSTYRNWAPGEPNFSDQYTYILAGGQPAAGQWNNTSDQTATGYESGLAVPDFGVVEIVPEPGTYLLVLVGGFVIWRKLVKSR